MSENPHVRPSFSPCWYKQANRVALTLFSLARAGSQVRRCGLKQASFSNKTLDNRISLAKIKHQDSPLLSVNLKTVGTLLCLLVAIPKKAEGDSFWFILIIIVGPSLQTTMASSLCSLVLVLKAAARNPPISGGLVVLSTKVGGRLTNAQTRHF